MTARSITTAPPGVPAAGDASPGHARRTRRLQRQPDRLLRIAGPIVRSQLGHSGIITVDALMIHRAERRSHTIGSLSVYATIPHHNAVSLAYTSRKPDDTEAPILSRSLVCPLL